MKSFNPLYIGSSCNLWEVVYWKLPTEVSIPFISGQVVIKAPRVKSDLNYVSIPFISGQVVILPFLNG